MRVPPPNRSFNPQTNNTDNSDNINTQSNKETDNLNLHATR